eukprot:6807598-Prymnesium_polylepis.2
MGERLDPPTPAVVGQACAPPRTLFGLTESPQDRHPRLQVAREKAERKVAANALQLKLAEQVRKRARAARAGEGARRAHERRPRGIACSVWRGVPRRADCVRPSCRPE